MIEFRHVSKSYNKGALKAVDGLDLVVRPGEIFGFLGPNGAGKTTTSFLLTAVGMIIDLAKPLLDWTNPQKAIKQNLNILLATFADIAILAMLGFFSRLLGKWGAGDGLIVAILFAISILLSIASFHLLMEFARKRYTEIKFDLAGIFNLITSSLGVR